jgi:CubicO group peptidase (beta-lactamase class C family)
MKKVLKVFLYSVFIAIVLFNLWVILSGKTFFYTALRYQLPGIYDYSIFENRAVQASNGKALPLSKEYNAFKLSDSTQKYLDSLGTIAVVIIKNDSLLFESYAKEHSPEKISGSFSMAKSVVAAAIGTAIKQGFIKNVDQPVADFLSDFKTTDKRHITIRHLLMMSSGLNWDEAYASPFSVTTEAYYGDDLPAIIKPLAVKEAPGVFTDYKSGDTQILSFVLEKATGQSMSAWISKSLWIPMQAENQALWSLDRKDGHEKAYCCLNATARDFARIGMLYSHSGNWNGQQLIDTSFVRFCVEPNGLPDHETNAPVDYYGGHWWIMSSLFQEPVFYARGILGQYVIVVPQRNLVIVRLGHKRGTKIGMHYKESVDLTLEAIRMAGK